MIYNRYYTLLTLRVCDDYPFEETGKEYFNGFGNVILDR